MMKMKYITPEIIVVEAAMEAGILAASGGEGSYNVADEEKDAIQSSDDEMIMGSKGYSDWEAWDE